MKMNRTPTSAILAALAALTLVVPAGAQQAPPSQTPTTAPSGSPSASPSGSPTAKPSSTPEAPAAKPTQNADGTEVTVTGKNTLVDAFAMATKTLEAGKVKEVTIKVTTCDEQMLPSVIDAKGKINLVGCGDKPAGPGGDLRAPRTVLVTAEADHANGITVKSPLSITGVRSAIPGVLLQTSSSLKVTNSFFTGKTVNGKRTSRLMKSNIDNTKVAEEIIIDNVGFYHVALFSGDTSGAKIEVKNSMIHEVPEKDREMMFFGPAKTVAGPVLIENNEFDGHFVRDEETLFQIQRPNVVVQKNTFYLDHPGEVGGGIRLVSPEASVGLPLKGIEIKDNQFIGPVAIDNPSGIPIEKGAVVVRGNDFSRAAAVLPAKDKKKGTVTPDDVIDAQENFWGEIKTDEVMADTTKELKAQPKMPVMRLVSRVSGETRFETAVTLSRSLYRGGTDTVVLARSDDASDSVSAVPLAEEVKAPILLTQSNELHKATAAEIKRVLPKGGKVILMGGEKALSKAVEEAVAKVGVPVTVERVAGANRAGTAVETAKRLKAIDKHKEFVIVDGADWQPDLISGPVASEIDGATLLTNGDQMAPETAAYLKENATVKATAIGDKAIKASNAKEKIEGAEPTALSLAVAKHFFKDAKTLGIATTADFADALAGGRHIANDDGPLLLVPSTVPASVNEYIKGNLKVGWLTVYGGTTRFSEDVVTDLGK